MAKVLTPLLSLSATGSLGKTIVFSRWKGIKTARQYTKPSNPRTDGQVAQRNMMGTIVEFWRNPTMTQNIKESWGRVATVASHARSGFNEFVSAAVRAGNELADASFASQIHADTSTSLRVVMKNLDDFADGDEAGDFTLFHGSSPTNLTLTSTAAIIGGDITFTVPADPEGIKYCKVVKTAGAFVGASRSGIMRLEMSP